MNDSWDKLLNVLLSKRKIIKNDSEYFKISDKEISINYVVFEYEKYHFYVITHISDSYLSDNKFVEFTDTEYKLIKNTYLYKPFKKIDKLTNGIIIESCIQDYLYISEETKQSFTDRLPFLLFNNYREELLNKINEFCEVKSADERMKGLKPKIKSI